VYDGEGGVETGHAGGDTNPGDHNQAPAPDDNTSTESTDTTSTTPDPPKKWTAWIPGFFYGHDDKAKPKKSRLRWPSGPGASRGQDKNNLD
jgi:hypothetical protein